MTSIGIDHKLPNQKTVYLKSVIVCLLLLLSSLAVAQEDSRISSKVDTTFIKIGEQIIWTVTVDVDSTANVVFPEGQTFSPLETVEAYKTDTTRKKDRIILEKSYALTQFDSGAYKLPTQFIDINGKGFYTDSLQINVANVPVDTLNQKMYDIKELMVVEKSSSNWWKIILVVVLLLALLGSVLYWFVFRKKPLSEEQQIALLPPYDRALLELKKLENSKYLIQDEYKKYYSELTDIVRSYLEEDVHVSALESTTDQLIDKLELMTDAGELELDKETIQQFKRILQTADLVKFAKSKPEDSVAEQDRKAIEQIVVKTHDALPEPTEEELMQQAEFKEELERKQKRQKTRLAVGITSGFLTAVAIFTIFYFGPKYVWDTISGHPTKKLLEKEWIASTYGYPGVHLETPEVLARQKVKLPPELEATLKELQVFSYRNGEGLLTIGTTTSVLANPEGEPEYEKTVENFIKQLERKGAKNIITKQEDFTTLSGAKGTKVYGSGKFAVPESEELIAGKYTIILFGGKGFQIQVILTWLEDDVYAQEIIDRIVSTIEVKLEA